MKIELYSGNLTVLTMSESASVIVRNRASLSAPALNKIKGSLVLHYKAIMDAPTLIEIEDTAVQPWRTILYKGSTLIAPALTKTCGLSLCTDVTIDAPVLTKINGGVLVANGVGHLVLPSLAEITGALETFSVNSLSCPKLTRVGELIVERHAHLRLTSLIEITESLHVNQCGALDAPKLTSIGKNLKTHGSAKLHAPLLARVHGEPRSHDALHCESVPAKNDSDVVLNEVISLASWITT